MLSEQNTEDSVSAESVDPSEGEEGLETKVQSAVKIKKQLLRGSSEKVIFSNKFRKNAGKTWNTSNIKQSFFPLDRSKPGETYLATKTEFEVQILFFRWLEMAV